MIIKPLNIIKILCLSGLISASFIANADISCAQRNVGVSEQGRDLEQEHKRIEKGRPEAKQDRSVRGKDFYKKEKKHDKGGDSEKSEKSDHHRKIKEVFKQFRGLSEEEKTRKLQEISKTDPKIARRIHKIIEHKKKIEQLRKEGKFDEIEKLREQFRKKSSERKKEFMQRWENASPEKKRNFCNKARERCASGDSKPHICGFVTKQCGGI